VNLDVQGNNESPEFSKIYMYSIGLVLIPRVKFLGNLGYEERETIENGF